MDVLLHCRNMGHCKLIGSNWMKYVMHYYDCVYCDVLYLVFVNLFQYNCCLKFDIRRDRTPHVFCHYIKTDLAEIRARIKKFAMQNYIWISTIGRAILKRCKLSPEEYIKNLVNATIPFDELAIVITCRVYNIHCIVLLNEGYWTTHPNAMFHNCLLWLAYVGNFGFGNINRTNRTVV